MLADRAKRCPFSLLLERHCPLPQSVAPAAVERTTPPSACQQPSAQSEASDGRENSPTDVIMTQAEWMGYSGPFALSPTGEQTAGEESSPGASLQRLHLSLGSDDLDAAPSSPLPGSAAGALCLTEDADVRPRLPRLHRTALTDLCNVQSQRC